jgi:hypothetical protein
MNCPICKSKDIIIQERWKRCGPPKDKKPSLIPKRLVSYGKKYNINICVCGHTWDSE